MKLLLGCCGCLVVVGAVVPLRAAADDATAYRKANGELSHTLRLENVSPTDAGLSGQVWVIEPSGEWRVGRCVEGKEVGKPLRTGKLHPEQLAALANHLATQDLLHLPRGFGDTRPVAPHLVILHFGNRTATLNCGTVDDLTEVAPSPHDQQASASSRFVALVFIIENMTRKATAPVEDKGL